MPMTQKEEKRLKFLEDTTTRLGQLVGEVANLRTAVEEIILQLKQQSLQKVVEEGTKSPEVAQANTFPVPSDYREVVDTMLNSKFGIKMEQLPDRPEFIFTIVVPDQYSLINAQDRQMIGGDLRSRVIKFSDGVNGVRQYVEKVYNSFNPEMKSKIKQDA